MSLYLGHLPQGNGHLGKVPRERQKNLVIIPNGHLMCWATGITLSSWG